MPEETTQVEDTTIQAGTEETTETPELDYDQEFTEVVEKFETAEKNREGYQKRVQEKTVAEVAQETVDIESRVEEAIRKALPKLQATMAEDTIDSVLNSISDNDAEKKLIKFHFENSVAPNGTIRERLENAKLIANKKAIYKTQKEMAVALQNRQGLSNAGFGSSTEGMTVKDNYFSTDQLNALKAKGWDDKKIERLKQNLQKR